jgi:hypothetical protein
MLRRSFFASSGVTVVSSSEGVDTIVTFLCDTLNSRLSPCLKPESGVELGGRRLVLEGDSHRVD